MNNERTAKKLFKRFVLMPSTMCENRFLKPFRHFLANLICGIYSAIGGQRYQYRVICLLYAYYWTMINAPEALIVLQ